MLFLMLLLAYIIPLNVPAAVIGSVTFEGATLNDPPADGYYNSSITSWHNQNPGEDPFDIDDSPVYAGTRSIFWEATVTGNVTLSTPVNKISFYEAHTASLAGQDTYMYCYNSDNVLLVHLSFNAGDDYLKNFDHTASQDVCSQSTLDPNEWTYIEFETFQNGNLAVSVYEVTDGLWKNTSTTMRNPDSDNWNISYIYFPPRGSATHDHNFDNFVFQTTDSQSDAEQDATTAVTIMGMDCPAGSTAQVNHSVSTPFVVIGAEGSYGDYLLYNSTGTLVWQATLEGGTPNTGLLHFPIPFGYGIGQWYMEMRDNYSNVLFGTCYIQVYYDTGDYGLILNKTFYSEGEYLSYEFLAPDGEQVHIYDDQGGLYDVYLYGTGEWVTVKNAFLVGNDDVLKLFNASGVFKADEFFTVVGSTAYTFLTMKLIEDAVGNGLINNGDVVRFTGYNGYLDYPDFSLYLVITNADTGNGVIRSWNLRNYPANFEIDMTVTGIGNRTARFAYYTIQDGYTWLDDFYIPFRVYPLIEPDDEFGVDLLPRISQPLGSIIGFLIVLFATLSPMIIAGSVGNVTGAVIQVPPIAYMITGSAGVAVSVVLSLFPPWVPFFLIGVGVIALIYLFWQKQKGE